MGGMRLVWRSVFYYLGSHTLTGVGVMIAGMVLTGALLVGDSVRGTLHARALGRIGRADSVLFTQDRLFEDDWVLRLERLLPEYELAHAWMLAGRARGPSSGAGSVQIIGCDERLGALAIEGWSQAPDASGACPLPGEAFVSDVLAEALGASVGEDLVLRVAAPTALSRDLALTPSSESSVGLRVRISRILTGQQWSSLALHDAPTPARNAFVNLGWLQEALDEPGKANLMFVAGHGDADHVRTLRDSNAQLRESWDWPDAQIQVEYLPDDWVELKTSRVFIDSVIEDAARRDPQPSLGILTYFVNSITGPLRSCPYSTVTAIGALSGSLQELEPFGFHLRPEGGPRLAVSRWLQENQALIPGDEVTLSYFKPVPGGGLQESTSSIRVGETIEYEGLAADPSLMPAFPGLEGQAHCRDWDPGIPIDLDRLRKTDERYWEERGGTPKAFMSLERGQELWSTPYGSLTAIRARGGEHGFAARLRESVDPARLGLQFRDLRGAALQAVETPTDFGGLFIGLSLFLLAAALGLVGLLAVFGVERRAREIGLLLALGFAPARIRRSMMLEVGLVAFDSAVLGALLGFAYQRGLLHMLSGPWSGAVAGQSLEDHGRWTTVALGAILTYLCTLGVAWLASRALLRLKPRSLLTCENGAVPQTTPSGAPWVRFFGYSGVLLAIGIVALGTRSSGSFFGAGASLLVGGLACTRSRLGWRGGKCATSISALGWGGATRRPGRSMAVVGLLAVGSFLVLSLMAHVRGAPLGDTQRESGTGGFTHFGQSALPLFHDPTSEEGRDVYGLQPEQVEGLAWVPLRMSSGDEVSCLNLGAPGQPRLVGVRGESLAQRGAFVIHESLASDANASSAWGLLEEWQPGEPLPAIGDAASIQWSLQSGLGEIISLTDERGRDLQVQIVATVEDSILQGFLMVPDQALLEHFPSASGQRAWLIEAELGNGQANLENLESVFALEGFEVEASAARLARFRRVQDTYLSVFQVLGGLGLLLGTAGLALVLLRNAHERRDEWRVLRALGFAHSNVRSMLLVEHGGLAGVGLSLGALAAAVALWPSGIDASMAGQALSWLCVLALNALIWVIAGARLAVK